MIAGTNTGNTSILIRVQARGGKFLGPDIQFAKVWVKDATTGRLLCEGWAGSGNCDSGNLCPDAASSSCPDQLPASGSSTGVVLTYDDPAAAPTVRYLTANPYVSQSSPGTASFQANFDLDSPTLLEIGAHGFDERHRGTATMWATPNLQLLDEPGFVVEIPGLVVTIQDVSNFQVTAKVTMMCGCPIDNAQTAKNPAFIPWPESEFEVNAELWTGATRLSTSPLSLTSTSIFTGPLAPEAAQAQPGTLMLWVTALQRKAANFGADSQILGAG